ncbi:MAG: FAD:protein FMN transferase [Nocardioidaceae bacterium]
MRNRPRPSGRHEWSQWSCTVAVCVEDPRYAVEAVRVVGALMDSVDRAVSRFRPDSELSRCNERAGRATPVSSLTAELVGHALDAADRTDGLVDPTVGRHLVAAGYDRTISEITGVVDLHPRPTELPRWRDVRLDAELGLVLVPRGLALDLGATAKAWTADQAAQLLAERMPGRILVEIGGDVAAQRAERDPFDVRVAEREGVTGELVSLAYGGLATSTTWVRRWGSGDAAAHHIIDPRTGRPSAGHWRTVSVWAPSALAANTESTAAVVAGIDALDPLESAGVPARLVDQQGEVVHTTAWPGEPLPGATAEARAS